MPPAIALLLCTAFVLYLLRLDRKQSPNVSPALWLPTIWMLSIASRPLAYWFSSPVADAESGSPLDRAFQGAILCLGMLLLAGRRLDWLAVIREQRWLVALLCLMLFSILWSDVPYSSFKRWIRELGAVTMVFLVLTERSRREAVESLLRRTVYILIPFSALLIKYFPAHGVAFGRWTGEVMWIGVTMQKNGIGRLCLISVFFIIWTLLRRWRAKEVAVSKYQTSAELIVLLTALWVFKGPSLWAASATGLASLTAGLLTLAGLVWMKKHGINLRAKTWVTVIGCIIGVGIIQPLIGGATVGGFTAALGRDATLTGRTEIWAGLLPALMDQPMLGHGFGGFWTSYTTELHRIGEAHNGYLDVCLGIGVVGLLLTLGFLLSTCRKAVNALARDHDWGSLCICYLLMASLHNWSESSFDSFTRHLMATLLILSVSIPVAVGRHAGYERVRAVEPDHDPIGAPPRLEHSPGSP